MDSEFDAAIRLVAFAAGAWTAGHYFLGANALRKAPHWVKLVLFPALVVNGVALCFAAIVYGSGMVFLVCAPLVVLLSIKDWDVWRAGAYMSDVLDRRQRVREMERQAFNVKRADLVAPFETLEDLVTPSGMGELIDSEKRHAPHL